PCVQGPHRGVYTPPITPADKVQREAQFGPAGATAGVPVSLAIGDNPGGATLSGGDAVPTDNNGVATFNNLKLSAGGVHYTLVASSRIFPPATSEIFDQAAQLGFVQGPTRGTGHTVIAPPLPVEPAGQFGDPVFGSFPITMALGNNPSGGILSGTLTKTTDIFFGDATFDDLKIDKQGIGYTLVASTGSLSVTSAAFNETGAPSGVAFIQQPGD